MTVKKWYFATNNNGLMNAFDQIKGAILSAKAKTSLVPFCILDDDGADEVTKSRIEWIENQGVTIFRHRSTMLSELIPVFGDQMKVYSGHWLRCDIPLFEKEDEYVLYTDIDVIFLKDVAKIAPEPRVVACGAEHNRGDYSYFNSGVMVMNVKAFAERRDDLVAGLKARLSTTAPYDDQSLLNDVFRGHWDHLPDEWNWKPYWGANEDALILHFHGPKPVHVVVMQAGDEGRFGADFKTIYNRDKEGYAHFLPVFQQYQAA
ncbi:glycosyltransferase [Rhizobium sp. 9140]|uniref:glycosyltransferase n=1 Tax=Rhizobium sp. 9140 TaxID=1761900 RepID=UPI00079316E6|nr:glycosyltransferase [Rhizobium sp. 9140]CZT33312.1 Lipopolysaccharide biosynthesis protein, LPS:glycosyltransferase [Rhizobium sp. 9140]